MNARTASPRVSVIIPAYNSARFLPRALASVFAQTRNDYEIVVVDDGSTDNTPELAASYGNRIRYFRQENGGAASARNAGAGEARGELLAFLDADDEWMPDKLEAQVAFMDVHPGAAMSFTDMSHCESGRKVHDSYLHERGYRHVSGGRIFRNLLCECFIFTPTVIIRREAFLRAGLFDVSLRTCEDVDLWLRVADAGEIGFIDRPLAVRHDHSSNTTKNTDSYLKYPIVMFTRIHETHADPEVRAITRSRLGRMHFDLGYHQFSTGRMAQCRSSMARSMSYSRPGLAHAKYILLSLLPTGLVRALRRRFGNGAGGSH